MRENAVAQFVDVFVHASVLEQEIAFLQFIVKFLPQLFLVFKGKGSAGDTSGE
jgi:hypothetical protein